LAKYLVTIATTVYNTELIEADSRDEAYLKGQQAELFYDDGVVYDTPFIENIELVD
jgi:hypothetical protein